MFELTLQAVFSGLLSGAFYALIALGLALVFGTMKVINLAHGELILLAAYVAYTLESVAGWSPLAALPVALVIIGSCAAGVYFLVSRIKRDRELNSLILTFGLAIILTNGILIIWSADVRSTGWEWAHGAFVLGGSLFAMNAELLAAGVSVVLVVLLYLWLNHSWHGRAVRAVSSRPEAAKLMGVNPRQVELLSFIIAGVLAAFAGVALYSAQTVAPPIGHSLTITAFIITVLAGMGSISGVLIGALLIGVIEALTVTYFSSSLRELSGIVLFLVVLLLLPSGLSGLMTKARKAGPTGATPRSSEKPASEERLQHE